MRPFILVLTLMTALAAPVAVTAAPAGDASFIYDPHGARDPLLPLVTSGGAIITYETEFVVSEMVLEGIISDENNRVAIVNGNIIEPGQTIGLYTVQAIEEDRVILLKDGETSVLQLKEEE